MLVLRRKPGQSIHLETSDGPITIRVMDTCQGKSRLAIEALPIVRILRSELLDRAPALPGLSEAVEERT